MASPYHAPFRLDWLEGTMAVIVGVSFLESRDSQAQLFPQSSTSSPCQDRGGDGPV